MKVKIRYEQLDLVLRNTRAFNPPISIMGKIAIARNAKALQEALNEREALRTQLVYEAIDDKSKKLDSNPSAPLLTPAEQLKFQPKLKELMKATTDIELYPIFIWDKSEAKDQLPENEPFSVDISGDWKCPTELLEPLVDVYVSAANLKGKGK